jgi:spore maturation protein CgeB
MTLLIVGGKDGTNVGASFARSAQALQLPYVFINHEVAYQAPRLLRAIAWHLRNRMPCRLNSFSQTILTACRKVQPQYLITTGLSPINYKILQEVGDLRIKRLNFLTDDPWNKSQSASWFFKSLLQYDTVFTPRRANIQDLKSIGCRKVEYLPFAYDPEYSYSEEFDHESQNSIADVIFVGGADLERVAIINAIHNAGMKIILYGRYWDRFTETRSLSLGQADPNKIRLATASAKVALCLVRRANRDGHVMRTFEIPAIGACMLVEDTLEHREIFGEEQQAVLYFVSISEMIEKLRWLLTHENERIRLARSARQLIVRAKNTYTDRLMQMLTPKNAERD